MKTKKCYIFGAGEQYGTIIPPSAGDYVIAADGGYLYLQKNGILADVVIGDFDSVPEIPIHETIIKLNPIKDETDMLSAILYGLDRGYEVFYLYGGTGGRSAHTIANIQNLGMLAKRGAEGYLFGKNEIITVRCNTEIHFPADARGYVSVFTLSSESYGVCETGLKYQLDNYTMKNDYPIGVSNEFIGKESSISVKEGELLILFTEEANLL